MPVQNALIRRCFQEAVFLSSVMIKHMASLGAAGMRESARAVAATGHGAKWNSLADALEGNIHELTASYCKVLEVHLAQAIAELEAVDLTRLNKDELSALARRQAVVSDDVAQVSARMQGRVLALTEHRLQSLDETLSAALQLSAVRPEINPFRPEIMCNVLAELCLLKLGDTNDTELWASYLLPPFAGGLKRMYVEMQGVMRRRGVDDARFKLNLASQERASEVSVAAASPASGMPRMNVSSIMVPLNVKHHRERSDSIQVEQVHEQAKGDVGKSASSGSLRRSSTVDFPSMKQLARIFPSVSREAVQAFLYDPNWVSMDAPLPPSFFEALESTIQQFTQAAMDASPPSPESMAEFHLRRRTQPPVDRANIPLALNDWLSGAHWGRWSSPVMRAEQVMGLKVQATQVSQAMALDCVGLMLEQLGSETSLLLPVREAFMALSPALMRLAFDQPWFLSLEEHPARRFVEMVAQASYEFNDEYAESFDYFLRPVLGKIKVLQGLETSSGKDIEAAFANAIVQLEAHWKELSNSDQQGVEGTLKAIHFVSERQALAQQIAADLAKEDRMQAAPVAVARLILEKWSLVLAHVRLIDDRHQPDPGGYLTAARDLLWSLSGHAAVNDPVRAFALLPNALNKLREGLTLIGAKPDEVTASLSILMPYHERLLEMRRRRLELEAQAQGQGTEGIAVVPVSESMPSMLDALDEPFDAQALLPHEATPWMNTQDRAAMGFAPDTQSGHQTLQTDYHTDIPPLQDEVQPELTPEQKLDSMREKDWFDMHSSAKWHRVQLVWRNEQSTLFMFQSREGSPHSMTRRSCLRLLRQEMLRPVQATRSRSVTPLLSKQQPDEDASAAH